MKIGILSDSHGKRDYHQKALERLILAGAQYLLHAGDIGHTDLLRDLEETALPYAAVLGNTDHALISEMSRFKLFQEPHHFAIGQTRFRLMHIPNYLTPDCDVIVYGHTHVFKAACQSDTLYLNPGEICAREKPLVSAALLEISEESRTVTRYTTPPQSTQWSEKTYEFTR